MMIAGQLAAQAVLSAAVTSEVLGTLTKGAHPTLRLQALRLLLVFCRTQSLKALPKLAHSYLVKV